MQEKQTKLPILHRDNPAGELSFEEAEELFRQMDAEAEKLKNATSSEQCSNAQTALCTTEAKTADRTAFSPAVAQNDVQNNANRS